jgi:ParB-like chromosome segregation protein Spo0J
MSKMYGEQSLGKVYRFLPEQLTVVTESDSGVSDERALLPYAEKMVRSMLKHGQLLPIIVRENGRLDHGPRRMEVVDGRQRLSAIIEANRRLVKEGGEPLLVEAVVKRATGDDDIARQVVIAANELRIPDPPSVRAAKVLRMRDAGMKIADIAVSFGESQSQVRDLLSLAGLDRTSKTAVDEGVLPLTSAKKLEKLSSKERAGVVDEAKASPRGKKLAKQALEATAKKRSSTPTRVRTFRSKAEVEQEIAALLTEMRGDDSQEGRTKRSGPLTLHPVDAALQTLRWVLGEEGEYPGTFRMQ